MWLLAGRTSLPDSGHERRVAFESPNDAKPVPSATAELGDRNSGSAVSRQDASIAEAESKPVSRPPDLSAFTPPAPTGDPEVDRKRYLAWLFHRSPGYEPSFELPIDASKEIRKYLPADHKLTEADIESRSREIDPFVEEARAAFAARQQIIRESVLRAVDRGDCVVLADRRDEIGLSKNERLSLIRQEHDRFKVEMTQAYGPEFEGWWAVGTSTSGAAAGSVEVFITRHSDPDFMMRVARAQRCMAELAVIARQVATR